MNNKIWNEIVEEVNLRISAEPSLEPYLKKLIVSKNSLIESIAAILASKLNSDALSSKDIRKFITDVFQTCEGIEEDLLKNLKFMALSRNIKLNALVKEILSEKIKSNIPSEIDKSVSDELDEIKKRISKLEKS